MAWTDEPTRAQTGALWNLLQGVLPKDVETEALSGIEKRIDRRQMSDELGRIRALYIDHKLDKISCFNSSIWDGFEYKDRYKKEKEEARREMMKKYKF